MLALTKHTGEPLEQAMARAAANPIDYAVKHADIADISDPARLALLDPATAQRLRLRLRLRRKYSDSIRLLDHPTAPVPGTTDGH